MKKKRKIKKNKKKIKKIKEVKKKFQKKAETEKFSKIAYFLAFFSVSVFFGSAILFLLFIVSMRAIFCPQNSAVLPLFLPLFCHFLPFFLSALLRYVRNCSAWRLSYALPTPPYTGGAEISLTPKKFFLFFKYRYIADFFYFLFFLFFFTFGMVLR